MNHDELRAHVLRSLTKTAEPTPLLQFVEHYMHGDLEKDAMGNPLAALKPAFQASKAVGRSGLGAVVDAVKNTNFGVSSAVSAGKDAFNASRSAGRNVINAGFDARKAMKAPIPAAPTPPPAPAAAAAYRQPAPKPQTIPDLQPPSSAQKPPSKTIPDLQVPAKAQPSPATQSIQAAPQAPQAPASPATQQAAPAPQPATMTNTPPAGPTLGDRFGLNDGTFGKKMIGLAGVGAAGLGAVGVAKAGLNFLGSENHAAPTYGGGMPRPANAINAYGTPDRSTAFSPYG